MRDKYSCYVQMKSGIMNKATRILGNMTYDDHKTMTAVLGDISEDADLSRQAQYINDLLNYTETNDMPTQSVMRKCGGNCLSQEVIALAKISMRSLVKIIDTITNGAKECTFEIDCLNQTEGRIQ